MLSAKSGMVSTYFTKLLFHVLNRAQPWEMLEPSSLAVIWFYCTDIKNSHYCHKFPQSCLCSYSLNFFCRLELCVLDLMHRCFFITSLNQLDASDMVTLMSTTASTEWDFPPVCFLRQRSCMGLPHPRHSSALENMSVIAAYELVHAVPATRPPGCIFNGVLWSLCLIFSSSLFTMMLAGFIKSVRWRRKWRLLSHTAWGHDAVLLYVFGSVFFFLLHLLADFESVCCS